MNKITILFALFIGLQLYAQGKTQTDKMLEEIQKTKQSDNNLKIVFWLPADYWKVAVGESNAATPEQVDYIKSILESYTIIIVGDYTYQSPNNQVDFSSNDVSNAVRFYGLDGRKVAPLKNNEIDEKVLVIIDDILKPLFNQMIGKMGSGLKFFVYDNEKDGKIIIDPTQPGNFRVEVNDDEFRWQLPLVSLMKEKTCSVDLQMLPGNYVYCPIHGNKL